MGKVIKCIICNSEDLKPMPRYNRAHLVKCRNCGLVFANALPTHEELSRHYTNYPRYNSLSPITEKRYNELLDKFEKYRSTNNLIDLGCSNGLFLECAKKRGWNVYGTEFDVQCINDCGKKGIKVFKSDQLTEEIFSISFDVVTSFEVIEHINTPHEEMGLINRLLRKGGALYITTPNFNSISRFYLKDKWNVIEYPEHLTYYSANTLNALVTVYGYKRVFLKTTGISLSRFRKSTGKEEANATTGESSDEHLRERIEGNGFLSFVKHSINFFLNLFRVGDAMKGFYEKL